MLHIFAANLCTASKLQVFILPVILKVVVRVVSRCNMAICIHHLVVSHVSTLKYGPCQHLRGLNGQTRAIVIAESLARIIAAIRITSVRWWSYLPPKNRGPHRPCSLRRDSNRAIAVHLCNLRSTWNYRLACESWPRSLSTSDWQLAISHLRSTRKTAYIQYIFRHTSSVSFFWGP